MQKTQIKPQKISSNQTTNLSMQACQTSMSNLKKYHPTNQPTNLKLPLFFSIFIFTFFEEFITHIYLSICGYLKTCFLSNLVPSTNEPRIHRTSRSIITVKMILQSPLPNFCNPIKNNLFC